MSLRFEWDSKKAVANLKKHGVTFEEATTIFGDPLSRTVSDHRHSSSEERFATLGRSAMGRLLVVIHADRQGVLRLITARAALPRERRSYETDDT